jgi:hypothetical protein
MVDCWNAFCINGAHDGDRHSDCTGHPWTQARGMEYNPATGEYDAPAGTSQIVVTIYERFDGTDNDGT